MKKDELGSVVNDDRAIGNKVQSCQRCGKGPIVVDSSGGEMTCSHCGFVIVGAGCMHTFAYIRT